MQSCDSWNKALAAVVSTHLLNFCCLSNYKQGVRVKRRRVACLANDQVTTAIAGVVQKIWCKVQTFIGLQRERGREREMISENTRCLVFVSVFSFPRFISIFSLFESNLFRWPSVPFSSPYIIFSKFSTQLRPIVDETPKASRPLQPHAISALNESLHSTSQDVFCLEQFRARTARRKPFDFVFLAEQ